MRSINKFSLTMVTVIGILLLAINQPTAKCGFFDSMGSAFESAGSMLKQTTSSVYNAATSIGRSIGRKIQQPTNEVSIMNGRRGSTGRSNSKIAGRSIIMGGSTSSPNKTDAQFDSLCLIQRTPSWSKNPVLHFFSYKKHGPSTYGCQRSIEINLNISSVYNDYDDDDFPQTNGVHDANIMRELIDSGLYNPTGRSYVLVHGFLASWDSDTWMCKVKDMILNATEANVFIVDWSGGSKPLLPIDYSASVANTKFVGQLIADFITELQIKTNQVSASNYHLIGHSLGAHISAYIGYAVGSIGRITALDPAGPCFSVFKDFFTNSEDYRIASKSGYLHSGARRLSPESADIVVALHTDTTFFGLEENCAHFDIFINGGVKQPECSSFNPADRFSSLMSLDLDKAFNFDITCAHSYSHNLLDFIGIPLAGTVFGPGAHRVSGSEFEIFNETCTPMAYRCVSYAAFKAGECGFCATNSSDCVHTGLDFIKEHEDQLLEQVERMEREEAVQMEMDAKSGEGKFENKGEMESDDDNFNDEGESGSSNSSDSDAGDADRMISHHSHGRHFIRSGAGSPTCLYHYQIVIASTANQDPSDRRHFYLQLPLDSGKSSETNNEYSRLVQISHMIDEESRAYSRFSNEHAASVLDKIKLNGIRRGERQQSDRSSRNMNRLGRSGGEATITTTTTSANDQLDFYTALITFQPESPGECPDGVNGKSNAKRDKWYLCKPLDKLQVAHLWSADKDQLNEVQWISLNYMSGLTHEIREKNSFILTRNEAKGIVERDTVSSANRPSIHDLGRSKSPFDHPIATLFQPVDCLVSVLDQSGSGKSNTNLKCRRSASEMKYSIELKPIS